MTPPTFRGIWVDFKEGSVRFFEFYSGEMRSTECSRMTQTLEFVMGRSSRVQDDFVKVRGEPLSLRYWEEIQSITDRQSSFCVLFIQVWSVCIRRA